MSGWKEIGTIEVKDGLELGTGTKIDVPDGEYAVEIAADDEGRIWELRIPFIRSNPSPIPMDSEDDEDFEGDDEDDDDGFWDDDDDEDED